MANSKSLSSTTTFIPLTLFSSLAVIAVAAAYHQSISPSSLGFAEEKLTHMHFFFHDVVSGPNPTMIISAEPLKGKSNSPLPFGSLVVMEDPLTEGPEPNSKPVGKAQGLYTQATQREGMDFEFIMGMTFAFTEGKFNGSTLSVFGRNYVSSAVREMPIIGGTGAFRYSRGFVRERNHVVDHLKGDGIMEYDVYVFHYEVTNSGSHHEDVFRDGVEFMADPLLSKIE